MYWGFGDWFFHPCHIILSVKPGNWKDSHLIPSTLCWRSGYSNAHILVFLWKRSCLPCLFINHRGHENFSHSMFYLIQAAFVIRPIEPSFSSSVFPSILLSENLSSSYFFSATCSFLVVSLLELKREMGNSPIPLKNCLWKVEVLIILYVCFVLLSMRLNFIVDIVTGLIFGHLIYQKIEPRGPKMQEKILSLYDKLVP